MAIGTSESPSTSKISTRQSNLNKIEAHLNASPIRFDKVVSQSTPKAINKKKKIIHESESEEDSDCNYALVQWLCDETFSVVPISCVLGEQYELELGAIYDVRYGNDYLKAIMKIRGE